MTEKKNKELEKLLTKAEDLDWSYSIWNESKSTYHDERNYVELNKYSPAGEDFGIVVDFDINAPVKSFIKDLEYIADDFDVDEHVELWVDSRGKNGVPNTVRELVEDAEAIKEMLYELAEALK